MSLEPFFFAGGFTLLGAVAVMLVRRRWLRRKRAAAPKLMTDDSARLERLEQGMEAIAIEIERVSEGQRFVTRLLAETQGQIAESSSPTRR